MKTAIVYASVHHGNTKKIVDEIAKNEEVDLMNSSLNPPFEMGDQAKPKRCLEY